METPSGEFEKLRRLLALKRYERPPAGCLDDMRQAVLARLRQEENRQAASPAEPRTPWWLVIREVLPPRPLWAGLVGVGVSALVIGALWQAEQLQLPGGLEGAGLAPVEVPAARPTWPAEAPPALPVLAQPGGLLAATNLPLSPARETVPGGMPGGLFAPPSLEVQRASSAPPAVQTVPWR